MYALYLPFQRICYITENCFPAKNIWSQPRNRRSPTMEELAEDYPEAVEYIQQAVEDHGEE